MPSSVPEETAEGHWLGAIAEREHSVRQTGHAYVTPTPFEDKNENCMR